MWPSLLLRWSLVDAISLAHGDARALLPPDAVAVRDGYEFEVPAEGIEPILARLIESGHGVAGLSIERPSLHEVFVKLVRDAEGEAA